MTDLTPPNPERTGIIFLGLCDRVTHIQEGSTGVYHWNVLGLKNVALCHIFPAKLAGWWIAFALSPNTNETTSRLRLSDTDGKSIGNIGLTVKPASPSDEDAVLRRDGPMVPVYPYGWTVTFFRPQNSAIVIPKAGLYYIEHRLDETYERIGMIEFAVIDPPPLTPDRITAIKSDPRAAKAIRIELGCNHCASGCKAYAALERSDEIEKDGWLWYQDIPDGFQCKCGQTSIDLQYIRRNLHGLLGQHMEISEEIEFLPLYHTAALKATRNNLVSLILKKPKEETIQQFLEEDPILMHQFPAIRIVVKPKILNFHVADFGIVTPKKELLFIELEKSDIPLMKKKGGIAAPLNHAFDQVRDWLHEADEHRLALLDSLGIDRDEVGIIRGVIIAGRDAGYDAKNLRKLKGADWGRSTFLTYDDVVFAMDALIRRVEGL
jgi:hypothetical protein